MEMEKISISGAKIEDVQRNALSVLKRFELVTVNQGLVTLNADSIEKSGGNKEAIWAAAKNESSFLSCIDLMTDSPDLDTREIAEKISDEFQLNWSKGSKVRNGGILKQWSSWVQEGIELTAVPTPPGRPNKSFQ